MTKLVLIRHGQTFDNVNRIMQGQTQGELTPLGIEQARLIYKNLAQHKIDVYLSSDLKRSLDTCRIIAGRNSSQIIVTSLLRERDWGGFTGRYIPDLKDERFPDDVESIEDLLKRAALFLSYVRDNYFDKTVLAVGHGIINKAIQAVFFEKQMSEVPRMENAEIRELILK